MKDKIRILYIDDYELDRELVKDALEKEHGGFEVMEASNKEAEALGVRKYIEKPIELRDLASLLREVLEEK